MVHLNNKSPNIPEVLHRLAAQMNSQVIDNRLNIPEAYGQGFCTGYKWGSQLRMLILNYSLKRDMLIENADIDISGKMLLFKLQQVFPAPGSTPDFSSHFTPPSFLIATRKVATDVFLPVHTHTGTINIEIDTAYLSDRLISSGHSRIIQRLLENEEPLIFEEMIFPENITGYKRGNRSSGLRSVS